jgi:hypothetical protein
MKGKTILPLTVLLVGGLAIACGMLVCLFLFPAFLSFCSQTVFLFLYLIFEWHERLREKP